MSDGMFDSGGSSDFTYIDVGGRWTWTEIVIVAVVLLVLTVAVVAAQEDEREHDRTDYPVIARENLNRWINGQGYSPVESSLWMEPGSSHRDNYHCKGGQFRSENGESVTFCCSVRANDPIACVKL